VLSLSWLAACHRDPPPVGDGAPPAHSATATTGVTSPPPSHSAVPMPVECEHTGLPALPTEGPFADCPTFDWVVPVSSYAVDRVTHLLPLAGGDMLVAGTFAGAPKVSTDCVRAEHALGPLNVFVERLRPDGTQVWGHTLTGGYDGKLGDVVFGPGERVWVVGSYNRGPLQVDGVEVGGVDDTPDNLFAVRFDPDGVLERKVWVEGQISVEGAGVAEDALGNVYVLGQSSSPTLTVGPFSLPQASSFEDDGFVAAFDPAGTPRWLTTLSLRFEDYPTSPLVEPKTLALVGSKLLVNTRLGPDGHRTLVRTGTGEQAYFDFGATDDTLVPLDPATGRAEANTTRMSLSYFDDLAATPAGGLLAGDTAGTWTDTAGVEHTVVGFPLRSNPFLADIDELGGVVAMRTFEHDGVVVTNNLDSAFPLPDGSVWFAGQQSSATVPLGAGTDREWLPAEEVDSEVVLYDPANHFRCGVAFSGGSGRVLAVAVDALGGVWMGGEFEDELNIETPLGRAAHVKGHEPVIYDGFLARFAPATPPAEPPQ
jgi:hypothetical protein